jgi:hypothetical protein
MTKDDRNEHCVDVIEWTGGFSRRGELLVRGSSGLALRLGIPSVVVALSHPSWPP